MKSAVIITASNRAVAGVYKDLSGAALKDGLKKLGFEVVGHKLVQDDVNQISTTIKSALADNIDLIVTAYRDWETDRKSTRLNSSHRL